MEVIEIKTLIDVTNTNVRRINQGTQQQLDQFRNWTTMLQCIGLRSIINYDRDPQVETVDVKNLGFGKEYKGQHQVWTFQFRPDRPDAFADEEETVALLQKDLDKIPMIINLTETINTQRAVLDTTDPLFTNTVVKAL
jgi:hypothetical protein